MGQEDRRPAAERVRIAAAFYAIVFIGISAGASGVLLPAQITDFDVDKSTIGLVFVAFSFGYIACAAANGVLIHRLGIRTHLILGTTVSLLATSIVSLRPSFAVFVALQAAVGFGGGALEAGLNSYLSTLRGSTALLNYFHAFFGVGALAGPVVAAAMLDSGLAWTAFYVLLAALMVPMAFSFGFFPKVVRVPAEVERPRLTIALRTRAVWLAAAFLGVYVGLEVGVGNWGFSFLTEDRGQAVLAAGWIVSGYWLGLTVGRFVLNALAERMGVGVVGLCAVCIGGVGVSALVVWAVPTAVVASAGMATLGFFLGPLFPTVIATMPGLVPHNLVATAIGVLVGLSVVGGALFPWLVGASAQRVGAWVLLPITLALTAVLGLLWWRIARRLSPVATASLAEVVDA